MEIELNPIEFITFGTVGPKGKRIFHLQAGDGRQIVTLTIEKEQTLALGEAIGELLDDLKERYPVGAEGNINLKDWRMELRDPVEALFRVAQIGLGYDESQNMIVIVAQELVVPQDDEDEDDPDLLDLGVVRLWGTRDQFRALSLQAKELVKKGRANPKQNGRLINYWT
jgi:uncharacterized repeat protein (TIGR03847 family)